MNNKILIILLAAIGLALLVIGSPRYQEERPPLRIGVVALTDVDDQTFLGLKAGLEALGYVEGRDVIYLNRGPAKRIEWLDGLIHDHLDRGVDLLFVSSTPGTLAAKRATLGNGVPVVFAPVNDPLDAGIVDDLKQPGGNLTGIRLPTGEGVRLQWLLDLAPQVKRIHLPYNPRDASALASLAWVREVAAKRGVELLEAPVENMRAAAADAEALPAEAEAIFLPRDSTVESQVAAYSAAALRRKLPLVVPSRTQVERGALFSYGFVHYEIGRQAARLVDQIREGVPAGEIPVETAENYFDINLGSARSIGLEIPEAVLHRADTLVR